MELQIDVNAASILSVLRSTRKFLVGTTSADWSCVGVSVEQGFSVFADHRLEYSTHFSRFGSFLVTQFS